MRDRILFHATSVTLISLSLGDLVLVIGSSCWVKAGRNVKETLVEICQLISV